MVIEEVGHRRNLDLLLSSSCFYSLSGFIKEAREFYGFDILFAHWNEGINRLKKIPWEGEFTFRIDS